MGRIRLLEGDICREEVDAIVNAANTELKLGTGVAGAIRKQAGPAVQEECDGLAPVAVGEAVLTGAGRLPARHVLHAASMELGGRTTEEALRASTRRCLELAREHELRSIAFPALGTGVGGLSLQRCAEIMLEEARQHLDGETSVEDIRFVLFGEPAYRVFEDVDDAGRILAQMAKLRQ